MDGIPSSSSDSSSQINLARAVWRWWKDIAARDGRVAAARQLLSAVIEFARDSTPERRRQRYGDAEYDWEHRVNTTSAAVGWRDRLLGVFHSPYQPTESALFHEMIGALSTQAGFDFRDFTFIDLGSGKGRTLLMASDYPFRRIVGVELLPALNQAAQENLGRYQSKSQKCSAIESICADATEFPFPVEPTLLFTLQSVSEVWTAPYDRSLGAALECASAKDVRALSQSDPGSRAWRERYTGEDWRDTSVCDVWVAVKGAVAGLRKNNIDLCNIHGISNLQLGGLYGHA
jgi:methyltransferase family protein